MERYDSIYDRLAQMIEEGKGKTDTLTYLAREAEQVFGNQVTISILLIDPNGLLRNGASPGLPQDYLSAIDGIRPDPKVGTCAAVAATGTMVITPDFRADDKWAELRHLPLSIGYSGAFSVPIKDNAGKVMGTFGAYFREPRHPSGNEISHAEQFANAASLVLSR